MTLAQIYLKDFTQEMQSTRKLLAVVPDQDSAFQPHLKSMTIAQVAGHIADMPSLVKMIAETDTVEIQSGMEQYRFSTTAHALETFDKLVAEAESALTGLTDADLEKHWSLTFGGQPVVAGTKLDALRNLVLHHIIHHRAQLGVFLRLKDVEIPGMYGPSHDEMKHWTS